jgi:hypothetical protein
MTKNLPSVLTSALLLVALAGCATTSVMGSGFEQVDSNTYVLKVGTGGGIIDQAVAAEEAAKSRLDVEAKQFLTTNTKYSSYKITNTERSVFPLTYYKYTVEFK